MPATPVIYYGDEKGMWGADSPRNRKPMLWDDYAPYEDETDDLSKYDSPVLKKDGRHKQQEFRRLLNRY